jgi:hypothetical protein
MPNAVWLRFSGRSGDARPTGSPAGGCSFFAGRTVGNTPAVPGIGGVTRTPCASARTVGFQRIRGCDCQLVDEPVPPGAWQVWTKRGPDTPAHVGASRRDFAGCPLPGTRLSATPEPSRRSADIERLSRSPFMEQRSARSEAARPDDMNGRGADPRHIDPLRLNLKGPCHPQERAT